MRRGGQHQPLLLLRAPGAGANTESGRHCCSPLGHLRVGGEMRGGSEQTAIGGMGGGLLAGGMGGGEGGLEKQAAAAAAIAYGTSFTEQYWTAVMPSEVLRGTAGAPVVPGQSG